MLFALKTWRKKILCLFGYKLKNKFKIICLVIILILLNACYQDIAPIQVASILPLSGSYYLEGREIKNGIELAVDSKQKILGRNIKFIVQNDMGDYEMNINAYNKILSDKNNCAIIGGGNSKLTESIASISQRNALPIIVPSASVKIITQYGNNIYRVCFSDDVQGICMARFAKEDLAAKTAVVLYNQDSEYSKALALAFSKEFGEGVQIKSYEDSDLDFKNLLGRLRLIEPDVVFAPDDAYKAAIIFEQMRELDVRTIVLGGDTWENIIEKSSNARFLSNIYFCSHYSRDNKEFIKKYKTRYKKEPGSFAALGFDAANVLFDAIEKANSVEKDKILEALSQVNYDGVTGNIKFDENRNAIKNLNVLNITGGSINFIKAFDLNKQDEN